MKRHDDRNVKYLFQRLQAAGIPMPEAEEGALPRGIRIEPSRPELTKAYATRAGAQYIIGLSIENTSYSPIRIEGFEIEMPWRSEVGLQRPTPARSSYQFAGKEFPCSEVLNDRIGTGGVLEAGERWEGVLLAIDTRHCIPRKVIHRDPTGAAITLVDNFDRKHRVFVEIGVDFSKTMRRIAHRRGIYRNTQPLASSDRASKTELPSEGLGVGTDERVHNSDFIPPAMPITSKKDWSAEEL